MYADLVLAKESLVTLFFFLKSQNVEDGWNRAGRDLTRVKRIMAYVVTGLDNVSMVHRWWMAFERTYRQLYPKERCSRARGEHQSGQSVYICMVSECRNGSC